MLALNLGRKKIQSMVSAMAHGKGQIDDVRGGQKETSRDEACENIVLLMRSFKNNVRFPDITVAEENSL